MNYLFIDSETTGLWKKDLAPDDASQPHLVEIGAILTTGALDRGRSEFSAIIKPKGWAIENDARHTHGIDERTATRQGLPLLESLALFKAMVDQADKIVAHNMEFDRKVIRSALVRDTKTDSNWWDRRAGDMLCTMEMATPIMKLGSDWGDDRWPSLHEAYEFFTGFRFPEMLTHRALHDARTTEAIFWRMKEQGVIDGNQTADTLDGILIEPRQEAPA